MAAKGFSEAEPQQQLLTFRDFSCQAEVQALHHTLRENSYVHAYLISGLEGSGKRSLAMLIAQYLLCTCEQEPQGFLAAVDLPKAERPCGACSGCVQVKSGNHPDLIRFGGGRHISQDSKDQGKSGITVGDIREAVRIAGTHTYEGGCRVFIIEQAEDMTQQAQNCLLKTLEEPIDGTVFLLTTDSPSLLLPTIISRCRQLKLHAYPDAMISDHLQGMALTASQKNAVLRSCSGSIGRAMQLAGDEAFWKRRAAVMADFFSLKGRSDIVAVSNRYKDGKEQWVPLLNDVEDLVRTLLLIRLGRIEKDAAADYPAQWQLMAQEAPLEAFSVLLDAVSEARRLRLSQVNWQAILERLLFKLMEEKTKWSR